CQPEFGLGAGLDDDGEIAFFFSSRRRHTRLQGDWSSDVCSSDLFSPASENPNRSYNSRAASFDRRTSSVARRVPSLCPSSSTREIGRASCRERVQTTLGPGPTKQRTRTQARPSTSTTPSRPPNRQ